MAADFLPGNRLTLLNSGGEYFPALLAAIESATLEIYLESYIFADDEIGHKSPRRFAVRPGVASRSMSRSTALAGKISVRTFWPNSRKPAFAP
jgi:hypothetical protein